MTVTVGAAFGLSGMANVLVLDTPLTYSRAACPTSSSACSPQRVLSLLGGYGRFTGGLLLSNPYQLGTP